MHFTLLTFLYCMLNVLSSAPALEYSSPSQKKILKSEAVHPSSIHVEPGITNIVLQSKDGGQTWHDISQGLPENEQPEGFFAGESEVYLRAKSEMYRSKSNLKTPVWVKESMLDSRSTSIAFNPSGVRAYNYEGDIYQKMAATGIWLPVYKNFQKQSVRTVFETSGGTVFLGCENGLFKSDNKGQSWKQVLHQGWVMEIVESAGVLVGTGQNGIMRSTDNGEHWEWVISEGGVGIAIEPIDGGFAAISYNTSTGSRRIHISSDRGKTWNAIDEGLPSSSFMPSIKELPASKSISSIKQMGKYLICGHPAGIFRSSDRGKTWQIVHAGVNDKVYKIYTSGNTLYAVLGGLGC